MSPRGPHSVVIAAALAISSVALPGNAYVIQSTFAGGEPRGDRGAAVALNPTTGDAYLVGDTSSTNFPAVDRALLGPSDAFIVRLSGDLHTIKRSVLVGGTNPQFGDELICAIVVDLASGDVVIAGATSADDLAGTSGGFQSMRQGAQDVFVARYDAELNLEQATYLGGTARDNCTDLLIEPTSGDIFVSGYTSGPFPITPNAIKSVVQVSDVFVARLSSDLKTLRRSFYLGGNIGDGGGASGFIRPLASW